MCASRSRIHPVAEVVQRVEGHNDDMPVLEPEGLVGNQEVINVEPQADALELQLLHSIEEAARENQRLIDTVRHFQEVIEEQTELLGRRVQEQMERHIQDDKEEDVDVVSVDDENEKPPVLINEAEEQMESEQSSSA